MKNEKMRITRENSINEERACNMVEKPRARSVQLGELLERIERIEARLGVAAAPNDGEEGRNVPLRFCALPKVPPRIFSPDVSPGRAELIQTTSKKWVNGTKLRYWFFDSGPNAGGDDQMEIVRDGFGVWHDVGIGIKFEEVEDMGEAEVRIGFLRGDGSWSFIGRDIIDIPGQGERTMNFGWDLRTDPRGVDVPVHEIGHTLGFPHEHQNPFAGIVWNEQNVLDYFGGPPNSWVEETTRRNILNKLSPGDVRGTEWDPNSIMHYAFAAGLIDKPDKYRGGLTPAGGLSALDLQEVKFFYPPIDDSSHPELKPFRSEPMPMAPAEQKNYVIQPSVSREYTIQTFGSSDAVMVLFEDQHGDLKYVAGDDDCGTSRNCHLKVRLMKGKRYVLRIRLMAVESPGDVAVMLW
jgi:hypothetical protein